MKAVPSAIMAALVSISLMGPPAQATLFQADDSRFGAASLTVDTGTGLAWLDLPFTLDLSYLQAEAATGPGGPLAGFRHATAAEVASLFASAGFGEGFIAQSSPSFANVVSLISLTGATAENGAAAITGTLGVNDSALVAFMTYGHQNGTPGYFVRATSPTLEYGLDTHEPSVGNWMVVVPEPSSGALLLAGAALVLLRRRMQKRTTDGHRF